MKLRGFIANGEIGKTCHSYNAIPTWPCATVQAIAVAFGVDGER